MKTDIGGDRLGSGGKQEVSMKNYERSTHDLGYLWRSSMASGTLVPFMSELALPGDSFDIDLSCDVKTLPTIGPLFGSYKVQLDVFQCPIRLYQGKLHMNLLNIGLDMSAVKLPLLQFDSYWDSTKTDLQQVNPSCILSYLGINGAGRYGATGAVSNAVQRMFNAVPFLGYWDIYKNYYANKQEERGFVITSGGFDIDAAAWSDNVVTNQDILETIPFTSSITAQTSIIPRLDITCAEWSNVALEDIDIAKVKLQIDGVEVEAQNVFDTIAKDSDTRVRFTDWNYGDGTPTVRVPQTAQGTIDTEVNLVEFDLDNIDTMRQNILADVASASAFVIDNTALAPYSTPLELLAGNVYTATTSQEGLGIKTYQSDLFNNWISTEWIDGVNGINDITSVSTVGNEFTIDALNLASKVYVMLNRIAISGGSYDDWLDAVYTHERAKSAESPIYHGSLIKELSFDEVVSNSETQTVYGEKPLGTLAGKGQLTSKDKGGKIKVKVSEPSYLIGIVSITPRVDYSQGNKWDMSLRTMDDLHKPQLSEIGYQDLLTDQMAWWDTECTAADVQTFSSAGKQPAWINYQTNVNRVHGNFADKSKEMFMTLNRRYEFGLTGVGDLTTYIDPKKYNQIFADTNLDAQNFWTQIKVKNTARRKMSAKNIPNL